MRSPLSARVMCIAATLLVACGGPGEAVTDSTSTPEDTADAAIPADSDATPAPDADDVASDDTADADTEDVDTGGADTDAPPDPTLDSDRDGVRDVDELTAGTDPHDPASAPAWHPERTERPRLLLDTADLPELRALAASDDPAAATVLSRIRAYAAHAPPAWPEVDPWEVGVAQTIARIAEARAFLGLLEADPEQSATAAALLAAPYPDPTPLNAGIYPDSHYNLHESEALVAACDAYDLLAGTPGLPAADLAAVRDRLTTRVETFGSMMLEPGAFNTFLLLTQNNHLMKVFGALGVCAIALPDRPDTPHAVVEYLRSGYVDGAPATEPWVRLDLLHRVMRLFSSHADDTTQAALLAVPLDAASPADLPVLGDIVLFTVPPDDTARACLAALAEDPPAARRINANELCYHTFDPAGDGYAPHDDLAVVLAETRRAYLRSASAPVRASA